jgi:hypothetical protein
VETVGGAQAHPLPGNEAVGKKRVLAHNNALGEGGAARGVLDQDDIARERSFGRLLRARLGEEAVPGSGPDRDRDAGHDDPGEIRKGIGRQRR